MKLVIHPADTTDDTTAVWTTSNEHVVAVNENGTLTAKGEGTATITPFHIPVFHILHFADNKS